MAKLKEKGKFYLFPKPFGVKAKSSNTLEHVFSFFPEETLCKLDSLILYTFITQLGNLLLNMQI